MATYRSTSPLQVQAYLVFDMEKYQPIEIDTKKHPPKHPSPVPCPDLQPCFSSPPSCWSRVCHQRRGGSGWLSTGWQEKKLFWSIIQFFKKIINVRLFGSAKPTVILHFLITVRGASGLLPGKTKPHKTYWPVTENILHLPEHLPKLSLKSVLWDVTIAFQMHASSADPFWTFSYS